jgi:hypothetical protein
MHTAFYVFAPRTVHRAPNTVFWIEPEIELAQNYGFSERDLRAIKALIKEHEDGIRSAWRQHFGR